MREALTEQSFGKNFAIKFLNEVKIGSKVCHSKQKMPVTLNGAVYYHGKLEYTIVNFL